MALPTDGRALNNILAYTLDAKLPEQTDNFFRSNPVFEMLFQRKRKGFDSITMGGAEIRETIIYGDVGGGAYDRGMKFKTEPSEFATDMQFDWKQSYAPINAHAIDIRRNASSETQLIRYGESIARIAFMTLADKLGYQIFGTKKDATNKAVVNSTPLVDASTGAATFDGFYNGVAATGTYGGIVRTGAAGTPGFAIEANVLNAAGAVYTDGLAQQAYGQASVGSTQPDLILVTQGIFNQMWERAHANDRNAPGPLRDVGFRTIKLNQAEVVEESHLEVGRMYFINTEFVRLWLLPGADFIRRGPSEHGFEIPDQDAFVDQLIVNGDITIFGPRYQATITNIKES